MNTFICFFCTAKEAQKENGTKTAQDNETVRVLRLLNPEEKISVKETLKLDNGSIILYLYKRPAKPTKKLTKEEVRQRAIK